MDDQMWIVLLFLVVLTIALARELNLRDELTREKIKGDIAECRRLQLAGEVSTLRNQVKRLETDRMFERNSA